MSNSRIAVVIGAASGIGCATAKALAAEGCTVTVADLNTDGAQARAKELGNQHHAVTVDVTDEASVHQLFEQISHVDVVVNFAGFGGVGLITELPADQFRAVIDTCLVGAFLGHQACRPPPRRGQRAGLAHLFERTPTRRRNERLLLGQGGAGDAHRGRRAGVGTAGHPRERRLPGIRAHAGSPSPF